jgi:hypothetical protein
MPGDGVAERLASKLLLRNAGTTRWKLASLPGTMWLACARTQRLRNPDNTRGSKRRRPDLTLAHGQARVVPLLLLCIVVVFPRVAAAYYDDITYRPDLYGPERPLSEVVRDSSVALSEDQTLPNPRLLIEKGAYALKLYCGDRLLKTYRIQLGEHPRGAKIRRYDSRTPDGSYRICSHNRNSRYYLSLQLDYPNEADIQGAVRQRRITAGQAASLRAELAAAICPSGRTRLGGEIFIHGQLPRVTRQIRREKRKRTARADLQPGDIDPGALREFYNWTQGCIGMTNPDIRELYRFLPDGTPVEIRE